MNTFRRRIACFFAPALAGAVVFLAAPIIGQAGGNPKSKSANPQHGRQRKTSSAGKSIAEQLRELRSKIAKLEAALQKKHTGKGHSSHASQGGKGPGQRHGQSGDLGSSSHGKPGGKKTVSAHSGNPTGKQRHGRSKMKGKMALGKKSMSGGRMSGMGMIRGGMGMPKGGMSMMGRMRGMSQMTVPSALPGFPGASHIYQIGATGFFLDHPQHITLTLDQKTKLNKIKEEALLKQATFDRRIEDAEQELWVLTSADKPDAVKIEAKIRAIAKLGGDKRIAFIRAVGQVANVLTDEQRKRLVGTLPADHKSPAAKVRKRTTASSKKGE